MQLPILKLSYLIFLFTLFLHNSSLGQLKPSFLQPYIGVAIPAGEFAVKLLPDGGFALPGISTGVDGAWYFTPRLGVGGNAGAMIYPVDAYALTIETLNQDVFLDFLSIRSDSYLNYTFTPQFYYMLPLGKKTYFHFKAGAGVSYAKSPYKLYKAEYYLIGVQWFEITSASDWRWNTRAGFMFGWNFNDCLGLTAGADFFYSPVEFGFYRSDGTTRTEEHNMMSVNLTAGLLFRIGKK